MIGTGRWLDKVVVVAMKVAVESRNDGSLGNKGVRLSEGCLNNSTLPHLAMNCLKKGTQGRYPPLLGPFMNGGSNASAGLLTKSSSPLQKCPQHSFIFSLLFSLILVFSSQHSLIMLLFSVFFPLVSFRERKKNYLFLFLLFFLQELMLHDARFP